MAGCAQPSIPLGTSAHHVFLGQRSLLVRTGVFRGAENDPEHPAHGVFPNVLVSGRADFRASPRSEMLMQSVRV